MKNVKSNTLKALQLSSFHFINYNVKKVLKNSNANLILEEHVGSVK